MEENKFISTEKLKMFYFRVTDLWQRLCEKHNDLFEATCDEYYFLLNNKIEELENKIENKKIIIAEISALEKLRADIIAEMNNYESVVPVKSVNDLLSVMKNVEEEMGAAHLTRFNLFLIDIIEKIQTQNKKNQLFINKALRSLKEIRMSVMGSRPYSTYNSQGTTAVNTVK